MTTLITSEAPKTKSVKKDTTTDFNNAKTIVDKPKNITAVN